jgi:rsbT co-antagonist protein RsbR
VIDSLPYIVFWKDSDLRYLGCSQTFAEAGGCASPDEMVGKSDYELAWREQADNFRADDAEVMWTRSGKFRIIEQQRRADGALLWNETSKVPLIDAAGQLVGILGAYQDITEQKQAEQERLRQQEAIIDAQAATLLELSTPLIPVAEGVLVLPLVGSIDQRRSEQIMETVLEGISSHQAESVVIDITGVRMVDTQVADALLRTARAVNLLGAQVILSGISGEVAQTLVQLGSGLGQLVTRRTLQDSIRYALGQA